MKKTTIDLLPRRTFLTIWSTIVAGGILLSLGYPLLRFLGFHLPKEPVKVKIYKKLLPDGFLIHKDFILFNHPDKPWAVSRKCTHLGCHLNLNENDKTIICPCHQSKFALSGNLLAGPAKKNLPVFQVETFIEGDSSGFIVIM